MWVDLHFFLEGLEANPFPCLFWLLKAACIPWPVALPQSLNQQEGILDVLTASHLPLADSSTVGSFSLSFFKVLCDYIGSNQVIQRLSHLRFLNASSESLGVFSSLFPFPFNYFFSFSSSSSSSTLPTFFWFPVFLVWTSSALYSDIPLNKETLFILYLRLQFLFP